MSEISGIVRASGLTADEAQELKALLDVYEKTRDRNQTIEDYYEGDVMVKDIGVDILPNDAEVHVDLSCDWPRKAVNELANLVRFDGFVFQNGEDAGLKAAMRRCNFEAAFSRYRIGVLKKGCAFATVNSVGKLAYPRFHSADSGAAIMDTATERMRSGFVIADSKRTEWSPKKAVPTQVNFHMQGKRYEIHRDGANSWSAKSIATPEGVTLMVPLTYAPTDTKPLGSTRINKHVQDLVDDVLRVRLALAISTAFYAVPMRALLGLTPEVYKALSEKPQWTAYINPMLMATADRQGHSPNLTQLPSNSPEPLLRLIESDAKLFSGATGVPLNSLGIVQDNPSSAEAIAEARHDLTGEAQDLIDGQLTPALREIALLVMMMESNKSSIDDLDDVQLSVMPHFKNPAMPSIAATTDAAMKIASVNPEFAGTDVFYEMTGFDQATIARINSQMRMNQARRNIGTQPILETNRNHQPQVEGSSPLPRLTMDEGAGNED